MVRSFSRKLLGICAVFVCVRSQNTTKTPPPDDVAKVFTKPDSNDTDSENLYLIIGIAVGSAIVIAGAIVAISCFVRTRFKKKTHRTEKPQPNTYTPVEFTYGSIDKGLDSMPSSAASSSWSLAPSPARSPLIGSANMAFTNQIKEPGRRARRGRSRLIQDSGMQEIQEESEDEDSKSQRVILDNVMYLSSQVDPETASIHSTTTFRE